MISLPNSFIQSIERNLGPEAAAFFEALKLDSPTSIRLNPAKPTERAPEWKPVSWCASGFYLPSRPVFTLDPLFHAGAYYVQEAASMFLEQILQICGIDVSGLMGTLCQLIEIVAVPAQKRDQLPHIR